MTKLRLLICLLLIISTGSAFGAPLSDNVSAKDLAKVEAEAKEVSAKHQEYEKQAKAIKDELNTVNQKMIATAKKIQNGEDELRKKSDELQKLQDNLSESEKKFAVEHGMLVETLSSLQNLALRPSESILVLPLSPVEVMRSSILLRESAHVLEKRAKSINKNIIDINAQKAQIDARLKDLEKQNKSLEAQRKEMEDLSKQKSKMYSQVSTQSAEAKKRADLLASQAHNLRDLLDKLEKQQEMNRKQLAEKERLAKEQAANKLREDNNHQYIGTGYELDKSIKAPETVATNFAQAKGKLTRPARGNIVTQFHTELSKGVTSNGIDIKTASKAQVVAPYDGTVLFSGPFKNFDNLIIIDHGDGYTSLLSGLKETYAEVGQMLLAGEPVGIMPRGDTVKLHMEIRKNNQPINPSEWIVK